MTASGTLPPAPQAAANAPEAPRSRRRERALSRQNTRDQLIRCGVEIFCEKGFQGTGIDELRKRVDVPKGSFYHFFESKQEFGAAVIDCYAAYFERKLARCLEDDSLPPLARLRAFAEDAKRGMEKYDFQRGCLVGNLGQELGGYHAPFRQQLEAVLRGWQRQVARCLQLAIDAGALPPQANAEALAEFFWIGWEGAILRAKLTRDNVPLDRFLAGFMNAAGAR